MRFAAFQAATSKSSRQQNTDLWQNTVCCRFVEGPSLGTAVDFFIADRSSPGGVEKHIRGAFTIFKQLVKVSLA